MADNISKSQGFWQSPRIPQNARMLYARHAAFELAMLSGRGYDLFLYLREDNKFLVPFRQAMDAALSGIRPVRSPWVVVDKCHYVDLYSDKIYLTDQSGAKLLWSVNHAEYLQYINLWANGTLTLALKNKYKYVARYRLQTEAFLNEYMKHYSFEIFERPFERVDFRYVKDNGVPLGCQAYIYACCVKPNLAGTVGLRTCPRPTNKRKDVEKCLAEIAKYGKPAKPQKSTKPHLPIPTKTEKLKSPKKPAINKYVVDAAKLSGAKQPHHLV